ncbi:TetR/AcrR family transcriptional regulator [Brevibacterium casei]|uniref:TetR/AcrR family transcriptional regulator n=1 Tax=Brevibacterium casei TaxID=33889 RepID=UPI00223B069D|nr:TetR/AcrR family transcriptional regulator [Brevibacterium casei]MCT2357870.1 TetR/AcrR family transcriptional regulator [Brevibacterium casei]
MSPRVGPSGPLSREKIVAAAIEIADETGLDAMTMKRVAERLDAGVMSLYRHVADKDELIAAMVEQVTGEYAYPDQSELGWREAMHTLARKDWDSFLAHPWMLTATASVTPPFGTASLAAMEWALTALDELELPPHAAARAVMTINNYIQGSARVVLGDKQTEADDDPGRSWQQRLAGVNLVAYPRLGHLIGQPLPVGERGWFADGLNVILDGVESGSQTGGGDQTMTSRDHQTGSATPLPDEATATRQESIGSGGSGE